MGKYIVQKGDNLSKISKKLGISSDELIKANGIKNPNKLSIGQNINYTRKKTGTYLDNDESYKGTGATSMFNDLMEHVSSPIDKILSTDAISNGVSNGVDKVLTTISNARKRLDGTRYKYLETSPNVENPIVPEGGKTSYINTGEVKGDGCLSKLRNAIGNAGRAYNIPAKLAYDYAGVYNNSMASTPTPEDVARNPQYRGDKKVGSTDSWDMPDMINSDKANWDVHYNLSDSISKHGNQFLTDPKFKNSRINLSDEDANEKLNSLNEGNPLSFGTYLGMGRIAETPSYTNDPNHFWNKPVHSVGVVGYDDKGNHIISSNGNNVLVGKGNKERRQLVNFVATPKASKNNNYVTMKNSQQQDKEDHMLDNMEDAPEDLKSYSKVISAQRENLIKRLGITPEKYDEYHKIAIGIANAETKGGSSLGSFPLFDMIGSSNGLSQLNPKNLKSLNPKQKKILADYGIDADNVTSLDLQDPRLSGLLTTMYLNQLDHSSNSWYKKGAQGKLSTWNAEDKSDTAMEKRVMKTLRRQPTRKLTRNTIGSGYTFGHTKGNFNFPKPHEGETTEEYNKRLPENFKTLAEDGYSVHVVNGEPQLQHLSKGNKEGMTMAQRIAYGWNNPSLLTTGNASTPELNRYVSKIDDVVKTLSGNKYLDNY